MSIAPRSAFNDYEKTVIDEIADHIVAPSSIQKVLSIAGKPIELLMEGALKVPVVKRLPELVNKGITTALGSSVKLAKNTYKAQKVLDEFASFGLTVKTHADVPPQLLEHKDKVADRFDASNALLIGAEGFMFGAASSICEMVPGAQFALPGVIVGDVVGSLTFLSRHICQVATAYGYPPNDTANIPHIVAAMAPQTETDDEGFFSVKGAIAYEIRQASAFFASHSGVKFEKLLAKEKIPGLIKLMTAVAARLNLVVTEKELAMLIPLGGAVLNSAVNVAFQQIGHTTSKDYFRRLHLSEKYGSEVVNAEILRRIEEKKLA